MHIFWHEMRRARLSLLIWTAAIAFMLAVCVIIYPEMAPQMSQITDTFADMGSFSTAFSLDQLNFGEFKGYFAVECGNVLGLGGAIFAAIAGITALAKEEKDKTAEFLLTHPISRDRVVGEKLLSVLAQIILLNVLVFAVVAGSVVAIGETESLKELWLLFVANFLMQMQIGFMTFGISAFLKNGGMAIGLGLSFGFYFLSIVANLTEEAEVLKYITPFGYTDGATILKEQALEWKYLAVGGALTLAGAVAAFLEYRKKDIG